MGKNLIIKQFQIARLDEWIGDIRNASLIYEEILKSDNKLSYFLEETIRARKNSYDKFKQLDFSDMEGIYYGKVEARAAEKSKNGADQHQHNMSEADFFDDDKSGVDQQEIDQSKTGHPDSDYPESGQLYREEALKPRKNTGASLELTDLKYSVSITAKSDKYLKLEIRGYHPGENKPDINTELAITGWRIKDMDKSKSKKKICRELYLTSKADNLKVYLTLDQWGLVSGSVIIDEKNLGDALASIHRMLYELCAKLWQKSQA